MAKIIFPVLLFSLIGCSTFESKSVGSTRDINALENRTPSATAFGSQLICRSRDVTTTVEYLPMSGPDTVKVIKDGNTLSFNANEYFTEGSIAIYLQSKEVGPASFSAVVFARGAWVGHFDMGENSTRLNCDWTQ